MGSSRGVDPSTLSCPMRSTSESQRGPSAGRTGDCVRGRQLGRGLSSESDSGSVSSSSTKMARAFASSRAERKASIDRAGTWKCMPRVGTSADEPLIGRIPKPAHQASTRAARPWDHWAAATSMRPPER